MISKICSFKILFRSIETKTATLLDFSYFIFAKTRGNVECSVMRPGKKKKKKKKKGNNCRIPCHSVTTSLTCVDVF